MRLSILRVVQAICRDPVMRLHDRHPKGKERGGGVSTAQARTQTRLALIDFAPKSSIICY